MHPQCYLGTVRYTKNHLYVKSYFNICYMTAIITHKWFLPYWSHRKKTNGWWVYDAWVFPPLCLLFCSLLGKWSKLGRWRQVSLSKDIRTNICVNITSKCLARNAGNYVEWYTLRATGRYGTDRSMGLFLWVSYTLRYSRIPWTNGFGFHLK
jgi:hypothetical protein